MSNRISPDEIQAKANEILQQEFKTSWNEKTYEEIRLVPNDYGFTSRYLYLSANYEEFSSSANTSTLLKLAKLDLEKGTSIPELVFSCCRLFPTKRSIQSLIELGEQSDEQVIHSVFNLQDHEGFNCLTVLFQMATKYRIKNNFEYPFGQMLDDIEESCLYLIQLAKSVKLDLDKILNHTTKNGDTLVLSASIFSERIMQQLLKENVRVNSINDVFLTPFFRVRLKIDY